MHNYEFKLIGPAGDTVVPEVGERFRVTDFTLTTRQAPGGPDGATLVVCELTVTEA